MTALPEVLARRAVHTYRRRDIFAYVSLRQYLRNRAALADRWADEVATELLADRKQPLFNIVENFKEIDQRNEPRFRTLHVPGPNDILAETALLAACAQAGGMFSRHPSVFSYILSKEKGEILGVFQPYFDGFKARHAAIAAACRKQPDAVVLYTDIKKFYPSIGVELALRVWRKACESSALPAKYTTLGVTLIEAARTNSRSEDEENGILTGPMISHVIGNLVLRDIDEDMSRELPGGYFRYVDDVAIVAPIARAVEVEQRLRANLERMGFFLHDEESNKRLVTPARKWLTSAADFDDPQGISWMTFVADMKRLLLLYPDSRMALKEAFQKNEIRIDPPDYSEVAQERDFLERLVYWSRFRWFRRSVKLGAEVGSVVSQCMRLRNVFRGELFDLLAVFGTIQEYERKRKLYRLKFLTARMLYLGTREDLREISAAISGILEMAMAAAVYDSVLSREVSQLLRYGPTAAQAAAQALRAEGDVVSCQSVDWSDKKNVVIPACAVLQLNGLRMESKFLLPDAPELRFSNWSSMSFDLFQSSDPYFRELGCVHGLDDPDANRWAIETAFDRDDDLVFDIQEVMQAYPY